MGYLDTFSLILIVGVIQGFIFNGLTFYFNRSRIKSILYLNLTVFFLSVNNLQAWLIDKDLFLDFYYIKNLKVPWNIFLAPTFYLFLVHYLRIEKYVGVFLKLSAFLFLMCTVVRLLILQYLLPHIETDFFIFILRRYNSIEDIVIFIFTMGIFSYSALIFFKQKDSFKLIQTYDNLKWIKTFFIFSTIVLSFWLFALFLNFNFTSINTSYFYSPLRLGTSFLIYWIGYQGLYQQKVVRNRISIRDNLLKKDTEENKSKKSSPRILTCTASNRQIDKFNEIDNYINSKKVYTNADLSLESLASSLKISTSALSQLVNKYSGSNFTDYINRYRVELAKELLINGNYQNYTILSIGLESGFNSKSTFYAAFKKFTDLTPIAYKRQVQENRFVRNRLN